MSFAEPSDVHPEDLAPEAVADVEGSEPAAADEEVPTDVQLLRG